MIDIKPQKRSLLYGTGLTKRKAQSANKKFEKAQADALLQRAAENFGETITVNYDDAQIDYSQLDASQLAAVKGLALERYGVLIGNAGTGKTTTLLFLIQEIEHLVQKARKTQKPVSLNICFCAFMGKSVQAMRHRLEIKYHPACNTIHATLGYAPERNPETGKMNFVPQFTAARKLNYDIYVIDEGGTTPIHLFNELRDAMIDSARVFILGDINQLPPITGKSVLGYAMTTWPTFELSTTHRTADGSHVLINAERVLHGKKPLPHAGSFAIIKINEVQAKASHEVVAITQKLHQNGVFDPVTDALIVPTNENLLGQIPINEQLVRYFNKPTLKDGSDTEYKNPRIVIKTGRGSKIFGIGDKVMLTKNIPDKMLTNGMTGIVTAITRNDAYKQAITGDQSFSNLGALLDNMDTGDMFNDKPTQDEEIEDAETAERQASHMLTIKFQDDGREHQFTTTGEFTNINLAYAFTCHKAQGSEYNTVIIVCHNSASGFLSREWLYTAITRAKMNVVLLCTDYGLASALKRQKIKGKTLAEKAKSFNMLQKGGGELPNLPEPEKWRY